MIGKNIAALLEKTNTTHSVLAAACSVDQSSITRIVNGLKTPSLALALSIANYFGCTIDDLLKDE